MANELDGAYRLRPAARAYNCAVRASHDNRMYANLNGKSLAALLGAIVIAGAAHAGKYEEAMAAYDKRDYATALRRLRPLANAGNAAAQGRLGIMFANGEGVRQSYVEARKWYEKAAGQNYAEAQNELGLMYLLGGMGVPVDYAEAAKLFRKAADQGLAGAQNNLGMMYAKGAGVPQDNVEAYKWLTLAASRTPASDRNRDKVITVLDDVTSRMWVLQIAEGKRLAAEWKPSTPPRAISNAAR